MLKKKNYLEKEIKTSSGSQEKKKDTSRNSNLKGDTVEGHQEKG